MVRRDGRVLSDFEYDYWGDCTNTFDEERKHYVYAHYMGLSAGSVNRGLAIHNHTILLSGKRILDVGGGPVSMLLKCSGLQEGLVWDPMEYPDWTVDRYRTKHIHVVRKPAEELDETGWDEVWMYNCLQHTEDPAKVIANCMKAGKVFRIFEWIDIPPHDGHPQMLTRPLLDKWIGQEGKIGLFDNVMGCTGRAYFGAFETGN